MVYHACDAEWCTTEDARLDCVVEKAFVNLGAMMAVGATPDEPQPDA
jgi:hypothetical protein